MDKESSVNNSEFGEILTESKLEADERENQANFGSIRYSDLSFSTCVSQIPDSFFFPRNDSLFSGGSTLNFQQSSIADRLASSDSSLSNIPKIDEIVELLRRSRNSSFRNENTREASVLESMRQDQITLNCSSQAISWPSVRVGSSFIQYLFLSHTSDKNETFKLSFTSGQDQCFQFVYNNQMKRELKIDIAAGFKFKLGILFLPLVVGKILARFKIISNVGMKTINLFGFGGEAIFRPSLAFDPVNRTPQIIFKFKDSSFQITNYGDSILYYLFDKTNEDLCSMTVKPMKGRILPMESTSISISVVNSKKNISCVVYGSNESLVKIGELSVIYGVLSDLLRVSRIFKENISSRPEIFGSATKKLRFIASEVECLDKDISSMNDSPENFTVLYNYGIKCLPIDVMAIKNNFLDEGKIVT